MYLSEMPDDWKFDLITFNRVIEHVREPVDMLVDARRLLAPDGVVYLELPDAITLEKEGGRSPIFSSAHCMVYSTESLEYLLVRSGLKALEIVQTVEPSGKWTIYAFAALPDSNRFMEYRHAGK
jgi:ubiquinone/menaquinone biosynthesis C-methylase UbiE